MQDEILKVFKIRIKKIQRLVTLNGETSPTTWGTKSVQATKKIAYTLKSKQAKSLIVNNMMKSKNDDYYQAYINMNYA